MTTAAMRAPKRNSHKDISETQDKQTSQQSTRCRAYGGSMDAGSQGTSLFDRVLAAVPYLLPLIASLRYGAAFFREFPAAMQLLVPLDPLIRAYYGNRWASLIVFFGIYILLVQNQNMRWFIRYNAMAAILLDILLIVPALFENVIRMAVKNAAPGSLVAQFGSAFFNITFVCIAGGCLYSMFLVLMDRVPKLPGISDAANGQVGY